MAMSPRELQRFLTRVDIPDDDACWEWQGGRARGYGMFWINGQNHGAHRVAYEHFVGPIPADMEIDHLCRNRSCCNPAHLEAVAPAENLRRAPQQISTINAVKTHCVNGHEFTLENIYIPPRRPNRRYCRACQMQRTAAGNRSRKEVRP